MDGTVHYRLLPSHRLPYGPICIHRTRAGNLHVLVDQAQMDPILGPVVAGLSDSILDVGSIAPLSRVRVYRDHTLGGDDLIAAHIEGATVNVFMPFDLVTRQITQQLGAHGTAALQAIMRHAPIIGQGPVPAA